MIDTKVGTVYVYHADQFARSVDKPNEAFSQAVREHDLPGGSWHGSVQ